MIYKAFAVCTPVRRLLGEQLLFFDKKSKFCGTYNTYV